MNNNNGMMSTQTWARYGIISRLTSQLQTGNTLIDTVLSLLVVDSNFTNQAINWLTKKIPHFIFVFYAWLISFFITKKTDVGVKKQCEIHSITPEKEVCNLFPKVVWFAQTNTNCDTKDHLFFHQGNSNMSVVQSVPKSTQASFMYKDVEIHYKITSELITIHADREYKRDKDKILLYVDEVPEGNNIFDELIKDAVKAHDLATSKKKWVQKIYRNSSDGKWVENKTRHMRTFGNIVLKPGQLEKIQKDFMFFLEGEEWYGKRGIDYSRGYMFYGDPGTGKSSVIKAMATEAKRHIHYLILKDIKSDSELLEMIQKIKFDETILVIEDIDCATDAAHSREMNKKVEEAEEVKDESDEDENDEYENEMIDQRKTTMNPQNGNKINGKKKKNKKKNNDAGVTLSGLLAALDTNVMDVHGRVTVITTNYQEKIDKALRRPGRIDYASEFSICDMSQIERLFKDFFDNAEIPETKMVVDDIKLSPAAVANKFVTHRQDPEKAWLSLFSSDDNTTC